MLYTSYFAKVKDKDENLLYAISASKPDFFPGKHLKCVAPNYEWVDSYKRREMSEFRYSVLYREYLDNNRETILEQVKKLPEGAMLCCYEGPGRFCHRHLLAQWLRDNGIEIDEYSDKEVLF